MVGAYERDAIRPYVLGRFRDLLEATASHPAMLFYLDNWTSVREGLNGRGLNENYARELLELHTLGVDGGYTQHDVTEFAKVLTGWSIGGQIGERGLPGGQRAKALLGDPGKPGEFFFRPIAPREHFAFARHGDAFFARVAPAGGETEVKLHWGRRCAFNSPDVDCDQEVSPGLTSPKQGVPGAELFSSVRRSNRRGISRRGRVGGMGRPDFLR